MAAVRLSSGLGVPLHRGCCDALRTGRLCAAVPFATSAQATGLRAGCRPSAQRRRLPQMQHQLHEVNAGWTGDASAAACPVPLQRTSMAATTHAGPTAPLPHQAKSAGAVPSATAADRAADGTADGSERSEVGIVGWLHVGHLLLVVVAIVLLALFPVALPVSSRWEAGGAAWLMMSWPCWWSVCM
uniref:Uncharacterized protein n=1 Tax=Chlamydomonas euryale TaxID=1486919 RepID=A0A7R9VS56_9CHLO|mmetsp:Transcript_4294/g.12402  ORF Transcript_4294/g.12402 Transcript_4294/m.12402 type:complete len:186 (+) Transcript_4294:297-854(+)|eukprot:366399-Chlamydomonas_euryale.AAC.17